MNDQHSEFELRLRRDLTELRPADGTPALLRARVAAIPYEQPGRTWRSLIPVLLAASVVAGAAVAIGLAALPRIGTIGFAAPTILPGPGELRLDPNVEGTGLLTSVVPTFLIAEAVVAGLLLLSAFLLELRPRPRPWRNVLVSAIAVGVAIATLSLATVQGFDRGRTTTWGTVIGFRDVAPVDEEDESRFDRVDTFYVDAGPGEPFVFFVVVANEGPIPLRLEGIVEGANAADMIAPRWTALALGTDPNYFGQPIEQLVPFTPITIEPGGDATIYVVGKASRCAVGPGALAVDQAYAVRGPEITLAYSFLGLTGSSQYPMLFNVAEPIVNGCSG